MGRCLVRGGRLAGAARRGGPYRREERRRVVVPPRDAGVDCPSLAVRRRGERGGCSPRAARCAPRAALPAAARSPRDDDTARPSLRETPWDGFHATHARADADGDPAVGSDGSPTDRSDGSPTTTNTDRTRYAGNSRLYAPLCTPKGLAELQRAGVLFEAEKELLLQVLPMSYIKCQCRCTTRSVMLVEAEKELRR